MAEFTPGNHPHDGECFLCKKETGGTSGNPSTWPLWLPFNGGNGQVRCYHMSCVVNAIAEYEKVVKATNDFVRGLAGLAAYDQQRNP